MDAEGDSVAHRVEPLTQAGKRVQGELGESRRVAVGEIPMRRRIYMRSSQGWMAYAI